MDSICRDFQRGACSRGERCRYRHVDVGIQLLFQTTRPTPQCRNFRRYGRCRRASGYCRYLHSTSGSISAADEICSGQIVQSPMHSVKDSESNGHAHEDFIGVAGDRRSDVIRSLTSIEQCDVENGQGDSDISKVLSKDVAVNDNPSNYHGEDYVWHAGILFSLISG